MTNNHPNAHRRRSLILISFKLSPWQISNSHKMASRFSLPSVETRTVPRPAPNGMGNGLFATTNIKPGEDVLHIKTPFVAILDSPRLEDTCAGCFGKRQMDTGNELKACTGCRVVKYCDRVSSSFVILDLKYSSFFAV